jgi:epoxyqueuosine reductase
MLVFPGGPTMSESMRDISADSDGHLGFPVPNYRFDQKNEMFKRAAWEEAFKPLGERFREVVFQERVGYRQEDFALRNAGWNVEWSFGFGNSRSNSGMYSWDAVSPKLKPYIDAVGRLSKDPARMSALVKRAAHLYGADLAGIARVHPNWVYSHEYDLLAGEHHPLELPQGLDHAVVLAVEMEYEAMRTAPSPLAAAAVGVGYSRMAFVANLMAAFIRGLGYQAVPAGNDTALSVPLAMAAGLGEGSRMGLLITKEFGPRVRLAKVFTDLPLEPDGFRPFGAWEFCRTCKACAKHCPGRAISDGEPTDQGPNISNQSGVNKWYVDAEKCYAIWARNRVDCATCIRVCPFNKRPGSLHTAVRALIRRTTLFNGLLARVDEKMGYQRMLTPAAYLAEEELSTSHPPGTA